MKTRKNIFIAFPLLLAFFYGCYNDNAEDLYPSTTGCDTSSVTYAGTVKPIMDASCATSGCHQGVSPTGYDLSTYAGVLAVAQNGELVESIEQTGSNPMPQGAAKLDDCAIAKIRTWVNNGAPNN